MQGWWPLLVLLASYCSSAAAVSAGCPAPKPHHEDCAGVARWLVHCADWGVMSTRSVDLDGVPFSNVLSFSDGALGNSTGRILLLMADMDSTVVDLKANAHASFTVTEAQLLPGACAGRDVEDPTCAKVVLVGTLRQLSDDDVTAREMVFARHPLMRAWHAHMYHVYELDIQAIRVLDYYGGFGWPSVQHYFAWHESVTLQ